MKRLPLSFVLLISAAVLALLGGCIAYVHTSLPIVIGAEGHHGYHGYYSNPHSQYYCYDCHGYTYFDPYYDYCVYYGFRFNWNSYPSTRRYYREHYRVIADTTPHFREYKYKSDYRRAQSYQRSPDYQTWKKSEGRTFYSGKNAPEQKPSGNKGKEAPHEKSRGDSRTKTR